MFAFVLYFSVEVTSFPAQFTYRTVHLDFTVTKPFTVFPLDLGLRILTETICPKNKIKKTIFLLNSHLNNSLETTSLKTLSMCTAI